MIPALALAALVVAAPDPCAPVPPAGASDPAAAESYRAVGDAERDAGSRDTAAAAYRAALARDPGDARSRAALAALCTEQGHDDAFRRGVRLMNAGDRRGAVAAFEEVRAGGGAPAAAALLEGICLYELGEDGRARSLLEEARHDPRHREKAQFFLGLLALRAGRSADAVALLESSAADQRLGPAALDLARLARREGRLVVSVLLDGAWDSNVDLAPDRLPASRVDDSSAGAAAIARIAPWGATGPFLRGSAVMRDQAHRNTLDLTGFGAATGWQGGYGGRYLLLEASYDYRDVGGSPYLSAPRLLGTARREVASRVNAGATYYARWEEFQTAEARPFSGLRHFLEADATFDLGRRRSATLAWHGGFDSTRDPTLAWLEQGPRAALRLPVAPRVRVGADLAYTWRPYQKVDPAFGVRRSDAFLDAAALLEWELEARWTLRASLGARRATSNVPDFTYTRFVPTIGLAYTVGLL